MDGPNPLDARRRCTARSKRSGERCKRRPALGQNVCSMHGAKSPQARAAARRRLDALAEPAVEALRRALASDDMPAIVRAAVAVLDRTGFHPSQRVEVEAPSPATIRVEWVTPPEP